MVIKYSESKKNKTLGEFEEEEDTGTKEGDEE